MTAVHTRPPAARPPGPAARAPRRRPAADRRSGARRTLLAFVGTALGIIPLKGLFSDSGWLIDAWVSMFVVLGPAALLRLRRTPGALDIWPGVVLLVPWLTLRFLHGSAAGGVIPTGDTWHQLSVLMSQLHETTRVEVAPIHTTPAVRLVVCALLGLLAALIDLIAVVGRRAALAGVPLLAVYTISGAVPRQPVAWIWFLFGAVGYLVLLSMDSGDDLRRWGRRVRGNSGSSRGTGARTSLAVSAPRIAVAAIVAAVLLPLLLPGEPRNLLADAFHGGSGSGQGDGSGQGGEISPFARLTGYLRQGKPRELADVRMLSRSETAPYYLRENVLSEYSDDGWRLGSHGQEQQIDNSDFPVDGGNDGDTVSLEAHISITGMRGAPVVFANPTSVSGLGGEATWSSQDQLVLGTEINDGTDYTERFEQPNPSPQQLEAAPDRIDPQVRSQLKLPDDIPAFARSEVERATAGKRSQYAKADAIGEYFSPSNGFVYDLQTPPRDTKSALVDFLKHKHGFCQQYAAAMAVMLRIAGVPARVVLGYMHAPADASGRFAVSTNDAHSWVEAWFAGVGWVPFDPTPAAGRANSQNDQPWTHPSQASNSASQASTSSTPTTSTAQPSAAPNSSSAIVAPQASGGSGTSYQTLWLVLAVVLVIALVLLPAGTRSARRHRRIQAGRRAGDAESLWTELSDTAVDLGLGWSDARSPRQVAQWLGRDLRPDAPRAADSLDSLAAAVELHRYAGGAGTAGGPPHLERALHDVTGELRNRRSGGERLRARFLPASLSWLSWVPRWPTGRRRR